MILPVSFWFPDPLPLICPDESLFSARFTMLKQERQRLILAEITANNKVHSADLSSKLNVSEDTIRRDLKELAEEGYVKKVHGGAMANPVAPPKAKKELVTYPTERLEIVKKCLPSIHNHSVLIIEGGESSTLLAEYLPQNLKLTVFTNSLSIAYRLFDFHNIETFVLGGHLSGKNRSTKGMDVIHTLSEINADVCFMELRAIHADIGITDADREYAATKKAMIKAASQLIAFCLSKDLGGVQPFKVESLQPVSMLVTELDPDHPMFQNLKSKGVNVQ
jgi:DeoR/GlpR family transcriptional regulator of sugar metabolism